MTVAHKMAYLISSYPAASHVFIEREVLGLRARGFQIQTLSINPDPRHIDKLSATERAEQAHTIVIKTWPRFDLVFALLQSLLIFRTRCWAALLQSWQLSKAGLKGHGLALAYWIEALLTAHVLQHQQIRHLHVHFANEAAMVGLLCKTLCQCQLSYTIHGPDEFYDVRGQQLSAKIAGADLIICISQFARAQLMRLSEPQHWAKLHVVRLGVQANYSDSKSLSSRASQTLLCVGRLCPNKGQRVLLLALAKLAQEQIAPNIIFAGAGEDDSALAQMAQALGLSQQVQFLGARNADEVRSLYQAASIFVLPSFAEGIPVVLMEAMASGLPCISTQINGIPELIEDEKTGLLVSAGDVDGLSAAIKTLLTQPDLAHALAKAAKTQISTYYDLDRNLEQLAQIFRVYQQEFNHAHQTKPIYTKAGIPSSAPTQKACRVIPPNL